MAREPLTRNQKGYAKRTLEALERGVEALERIANHHTKINDDCPWCGASLELREFSYTNNGAIAEASCEKGPDCGFRGEVVYCVTDIVERG